MLLSSLELINLSWMDTNIGSRTETLLPFGLLQTTAIDVVTELLSWKLTPNWTPLSTSSLPIRALQLSLTKLLFHTSCEQEALHPDGAPTDFITTNKYRHLNKYKYALNISQTCRSVLIARAWLCPRDIYNSLIICIRLSSKFQN